MTIKDLKRKEDVNEDIQIFSRNDQSKFIIEKLQMINNDLQLIKEDLSKISSNN